MWDKTLIELMNDAPKDWGLLQIYAGNTFIKDINETLFFCFSSKLILILKNVFSMEIFLTSHL